MEERLRPVVGLLIMRWHFVIIFVHLVMIGVIVLMVDIIAANIIQLLLNVLFLGVIQLVLR